MGIIKIFVVREVAPSIIVVLRSMMIFFNFDQGYYEGGYRQGYHTKDTASHIPTEILEVEEGTMEVVDGTSPSKGPSLWGKGRFKYGVGSR
jgi:hypothetical protein